MSFKIHQVPGKLQGHPRDSKITLIMRGEGLIKSVDGVQINPNLG